MSNSDFSVLDIAQTESDVFLNQDKTTNLFSYLQNFVDLLQFHRYDTLGFYLGSNQEAHELILK